MRSSALPWLKRRAVFNRLCVSNSSLDLRAVQWRDVVPDDLDVLIVLNQPQSAHLLPAFNAANQLQLITSRSFIGKPVPLRWPKAHLPRRFLRQTSIYACTGG